MVVWILIITLTDKPAILDTEPSPFQWTVPKNIKLILVKIKIFHNHHYHHQTIITILTMVTKSTAIIHNNSLTTITQIVPIDTSSKQDLDDEIVKSKGLKRLNF